jgi:hypothetical protein
MYLTDRWPRRTMGLMFLWSSVVAAAILVFDLGLAGLLIACFAVPLVGMTAMEVAGALLHRREQRRAASV